MAYNLFFTKGKLLRYFHIVNMVCVYQNRRRAFAEVKSILRRAK